MTPEAEAVRNVAEFRRRAALGEWVSYALGPLDRRNPVATLVRGWELQGLVELREEARPAGRCLLQFCRLEADFPPGWHDAPEPLPQPPSKRDPEAVGIAAMAEWAGRGDERPDWLRYAASHYSEQLNSFSMACCGVGEMPENAQKLLGEAGLVLRTFVRMLDPAPAEDSPTPLQLKVRRRAITDAEKARDLASGRKPRRSRRTWERVLAEHKAADEVERAVAEGGHRLAAIKDAAARHHVAEGNLGARLAQRARWLKRPAERALAEAADLAGALQRGGLLQAAALEIASEVTGQAPADIRKALKCL